MKSTVLSSPHPTTPAPTVTLLDPAADAVATAVTLVGLDWGTNTSCLMASPLHATETNVSEQIPTVIGVAADHILDGIGRDI